MLVANLMRCFWAPAKIPFTHNRTTTSGLVIFSALKAWATGNHAKNIREEPFTPVNDHSSGLTYQPEP